MNTMAKILCATALAVCSLSLSGCTCECGTLLVCANEHPPGPPGGNCQWFLDPAFCGGCDPVTYEYGTFRHCLDNQGEACDDCDPPCPRCQTVTYTAESGSCLPYPRNDMPTCEAMPCEYGTGA